MDIDPAELRIVHYPDPALRRGAEPIEEIDDVVRAVGRRMLELMHEAAGVGLAAPQVGLPWRLFVCRGLDEDDADEIFVNPTLEIRPGELVVREEGCLSLPDITGEIRRPSTVALQARDLSGQVIRREDDGFLARIWQHEVDHLDGVLIIDRMTPMDRIATRKALRNLEAAAQA